MPALQTVIAAALVLGCTTYAGFKLMPAALRRRMAGLLLRWTHLPAPLAATLLRETQSGGCGCDGCDRSVPATRPATQAQRITFHPRRPR